MTATTHTKWKTVLVSTAILLSTTSLLSGRVLAEGSFLLQLGTFASREEAQQKWEEVRAANKDVVRGLQGHVAEVTLPPDNTPSYRTQVGPVETRRQAKALCKSLEERHVDCFLVETAFAAADLSPEMSGDASVPPATSQAEQGSEAPVEVAATSPEHQIDSSPIAPLAAAPAKPAAPQAAETKSVKSEDDDKPGFFGRLFGRSHSSNDESVPEPRKTEIHTARHARYSNPNDVKKPAFFRSTFQYYNDDEEVQEKQEAKQSQPPAVVASASEEGAEKAPDVAAAGRENAEAHQPSAPVKGEVEVAEAIRVPVSESAKKNVEYETVKDTSSDNAPIEVMDVDDSSAYWVQLSYFQNENRAHEFYLDLRNNLGDKLDNVRIRINRPFGSRNNRTTLRVGPFTSGEAIHSVCSAASARKLRCTTIRDDSGKVHVTTAAAEPAARKQYLSPLDAVEIPGYHPGSAPAPKEEAVAEAPSKPSIEVADEMVAPAAGQAVATNGIGAQWISLSEYASSQEAMDAWSELQSEVSLLKELKPAVVKTLTSDDDGKYQLRAGPFETDVDAENACRSVIRHGKACSVIVVQ